MEGGEGSISTGKVNVPVKGERGHDVLSSPMFRCSTFSCKECWKLGL